MFLRAHACHSNVGAAEGSRDALAAAGFAKWTFGSRSARPAPSACTTTLQRIAVVAAELERGQQAEVWQCLGALGITRPL